MAGTTLDLSGLDGVNPLGFLTTLGTITTLRQAGETKLRLHWKRTRTWTPVLEGLTTLDPAKLSNLIAAALHGQEVSGDTEKASTDAQRQFDTAKKVAADKKKALRSRGLDRAGRDAAVEQELRPLEQSRDDLRQRWLEALKKAVPSPELVIGKRIGDCKPQEFREYANSFIVDASCRERDTLDLLAAFGSDACRERTADAIVSTPFSFINGSGHQFFLETVRGLMEQVTPERIHQTLFESWRYQDEQFSMRWDPSEDRRYALMDRNPTASGNKSKTVWMANLLAYRALALFPCAPGQHGLVTTAWTTSDDERAFTWPIWQVPATLDTVRSLLQQRELANADSNRAFLRARGIAAVFRSRRIKVGAGANFKLNFTPAQCL